MQSDLSMEDQQISSATMKKTLLFLNCIFLAIGNTAGPLIMRLYFIRGGKRVWLASWLETGGFPVIFIPLLVFYRRRRSKEGPNANFFLMRPRLLIATVFIGLLTGVDDYFYAGGMGRLPVSTQALIIAAQLAFTAIFAFFLVKQRFTPYSINAVVLLTVGAGVLALHTNGDRPKGETKRDYIVGFLMTMTAALLYAFILPLVEWSYMKSRQRVTYTLVLEVQLVVCFFATVVCTVGMLINKDYQAIPVEARNFKQGEATYYILLVCTGLIWQFFYLGIVGVIFSASSLMSAIIIAVLLPVTETLAVVCFHEKFQAEKGLSLALSLWGFISYFYGEMRHGNIKTSQDQDLNMTETDTP